MLVVRRQPARSSRTPFRDLLSGTGKRGGKGEALDTTRSSRSRYEHCLQSCQRRIALKKQTAIPKAKAGDNGVVPRLFN